MEPVVKVLVWNGVPSQGPSNNRIPPILHNKVRRTGVYLRKGEQSSSRTSNSRRPYGRAEIAESPVYKINVVLLGDGAASCLPCTVSNNTSVDL